MTRDIEYYDANGRTLTVENIVGFKYANGTFGEARIIELLSFDDLKIARMISRKGGLVRRRAGAVWRIKKSR